MAIDISNHLSSLLAEALEGGESGRAIFIKLLLTLEQSKPSEADKMMMDFLPLIPAADQNIITLVLDELQRAGTRPLGSRMPSMSDIARSACFFLKQGTHGTNHGLRISILLDRHA